MHFSAYKLYAEKNRLFLKKSSVRFFQKQPVFFRERPPREKMHIYAKWGKLIRNMKKAIISQVRDSRTCEIIALGFWCWFC
jgi:hypothetical protein